MFSGVCSCDGGVFCCCYCIERRASDGRSGCTYCDSHPLSVCELHTQTDSSSLVSLIICVALEIMRRICWIASMRVRRRGPTTAMHPTLLILRPVSCTCTRIRVCAHRIYVVWFGVGVKVALMKGMRLFYFVWPDFRDAIVEQNAIELCTEAMRTYATKPRIVFDSCMLLAFIAGGTERMLSPTGVRVVSFNVICGDVCQGNSGV